MPFIPCKQSATAEYNTNEGAGTYNMAKFIKRDLLERMHHGTDDISYKLSPYKNRITNQDAYTSSIGYKAMNQTQPHMRNEGQKQTLEKVLNKLNQMNTKLNIESVPSELGDHGQAERLNQLSATAGSQASSGVHLLQKAKSQHKRSSSMANSFRNFSNKSGAQTRDMPEMPPIMFDGKEVNTIQDLMDNFKLDNYEDAKRKREMQAKDPDNPMPQPKDVDQAYWDQIQQYRPSGAYYEHSHGDKLLYMKKVDRIDYDLVDAFRARKQAQLEEELEKLK